MPKNRILEEQKFTFIKNHLKNRVDEDTLIALWNQMCMSGFSILKFNSVIKPLSNSIMELLKKRCNFVTDEKFNENDKYYSLNSKNQYVSFNHITEFEGFDMDSLVIYVASKRTDVLETYGVKALNLFISNFNEENQKYAYDITCRFIQQGIINIFQNNWDNIYNAIKIFVEEKNNHVNL
jgi:RNase P/RNase MRP subunit POP5